MDFIEYAFSKLYNNADEAAARVNEFTTDLQRLFTTYQEANPNLVRSSTTTDGADASVIDWLEFVKERRQVRSASGTDLQVYLDATLETEWVNDSDFDILVWWKHNGKKYPILSIMAKDILSIPITSVASESAFSIGKHVIDPTRTALKPETIEMLMCGGDWAKEKLGIKKGRTPSIIVGEGTADADPAQFEMVYTFGEPSAAASGTGPS